MDISMIQKRLMMLEKEEESIKKSREMIKSELENNPDYQEALSEWKKANLKKKQAKEVILSQTTYVQLQMDMKESMEEIQTLKDILTVELLAHHEKTKSDILVDANGAARKIKFSVKILQKKDDIDKPQEIDPTKGL